MEMATWYYSNDIKKQQRKLNSFIKNMNKNIMNDELWKGRFFIRQVRDRHIYKFEDGSGSLLSVYLRFYDKKDKMYIDYYGPTSDWCFPGSGYGIWMTMNNFIVEECDDTGYSIKNAIDYTKVDCDKIAKESKPKYDWPKTCMR